MSRASNATGVACARRRGPGWSLFAVTCLLLAACAENPADNVPAATVDPTVPPPATGTVPSAEPAESRPAPDGAVVYRITPANSKIEFEGSKVVATTHKGGFNAFNGEIHLLGDAIESAAMNVVIEAASIWTDNQGVTNHLKKPDFFDVATYPEARFELTDITREGNDYRVAGNFTLHGVTKNISFPAKISISNGRVLASSTFSIDRFDYNMTYAGRGNLVRREVVIRLNIQAEAAPG